MVDTATITLGNALTVNLPYNPNNTTWEYDLNRQIMDTKGGRVVQILSTNVQQMNVQGDAGSRPKLLKLFSDIKALQAAQIQQQNSASLVIPAAFAENGSIALDVYIQSINIGWDPTTVTYPYNMVLQVEDSANYGALGSNITAAVLNGLSTAFGYSPTIGQTVNGQLNLTYQGLPANQVLSIAQLSTILAPNTSYIPSTSYTPSASNTAINGAFGV